MADFKHTSEDGTLEGRVLFVRHEGYVYRLLGVGTDQSWRNRAAQVGASLMTFQSLKDPAILSVQPARLRVVTVRRAQDLESLLRSQPGQVDAEQVRTINRLEGNPTLEVGRRLKVPVGGSGK
jgi:predicted Zn-dependent protease